MFFCFFLLLLLLLFKILCWQNGADNNSSFSLQTLTLLGSNLSQFYVLLDDRANDLLTTTSVTQVTSVTVNNNSPIQDYVHPDDQTQPTFEMTPGFKPFTLTLYLTLLTLIVATLALKFLCFAFVIGLHHLCACFRIDAEMKIERERLSITFTSNAKGEFVPRNQVSLRLLSIISTHELVVSCNFLSIRIVLSCFYLLIFYFEKLST